MAAIDFTGDFSTEIQESEVLKTTVEEALKVIESDLEIIAENWKDEESDKFLSTQRTNLDQLKAINKRAQNILEGYFSYITEKLNVYY